MAMEGAIRCSANHTPLSPISFLERAAVVYGDRTSIVYGSTSYTWGETRDRCLRLASAMAQMGISHGHGGSNADVVAVLSPNTPALYELHFAVPMAGGVICALTTHDHADHIADLIQQCKPKLLFVHQQYVALADKALAIIKQQFQSTIDPLKITICDPFYPCHNPDDIHNELEYESVISSAGEGFDIRWPRDEFDALSISYTSGTTGFPQKGVIYNHRGAYLNTLAMLLLMEMGSTPVFLWTIQMYHCNGWAIIWGVAAQGGANIIIHPSSAEAIFSAIAEHGVTHLAGTTPVLNMIANADGSARPALPRRVGFVMGGSPPPPAVLSKMEELGFVVTHCGGQTETYGCAVYCVWRPEWDALPAEQRSRLRCRQGLPHLVLDEADVKDPATMESVPADGRTIGEIMYHGNNIMSGYLDRGMTEESFRGGWFHSGDAGVMHPDGYIELKDRLKDIVVCGGKKIGTIEIESTIFSHPAVHAAAVVGRPDRELGETVCAFVELADGCEATEDSIIAFCKERLPGDLVPRSVVFDKIPLVSTGKTIKALLREKAIAMGSLAADGGKDAPAESHKHDVVSGSSGAGHHEAGDQARYEGSAEDLFEKM